MKILAIGLFMALARFAIAQDYYVDPARGDDRGPGSESQPFKTLAQAVKMVDGLGGTLHLAKTSEPYRENLVIKKGGLPEHPIVVEGNGATINLGEDVSKGPWEKQGDEYLLLRTVTRNQRDYVVSVVFVNGLPLYCPHPQGRGQPAWHGGSARYDDQNRLALTFPRGLTPENSVVVLTCQGYSHSGANLSAYTIVRNLTAVFAANDGFNMHGNQEDIVLENVKGLFNGDQGISSHDRCAVEVRGAEVAFNGSANGAIDDVNDSVTSYRDVRVHQNRGPGLMLDGARHVLDHVVSYGNGGRNLPKASDKIETHDISELPAIPGDDQIPSLGAANTAQAEAPIAPDDNRLGQFLKYRPPSTPVVTH